MTGPEHYLEGARLLSHCVKMIEGSDGRAKKAAEAQAHFLAALVALHAAEKQPESIRWQEATQ